MLRTPILSEKAFQQKIVDLAIWHRWRVVHFRPARVKINGEWTWRTPFEGHPGFVDLVIARDEAVIMAEIKREDGRFQPGQRDWGLALGPLYRLWRPSDWPEIEAELTQPRRKQ